MPGSGLSALHEANTTVITTVILIDRSLKERPCNCVLLVRARIRIQAPKPGLFVSILYSLFRGKNDLLMVDCQALLGKSVW